MMLEVEVLYMAFHMCTIKNQNQDFEENYNIILISILFSISNT